MLEKDKYSVINIRKYLENDPRLGEDDLVQILSEFSCEKNPDVERFLKKSSIEFTKKNQSVTYLVISASFFLPSSPSFCISSNLGIAIVNNWMMMEAVM